jgi:hypothetical protein
VRAAIFVVTVDSSHLISSLLSFFLSCSAISGKTDRESKRRDSMKIQEARQTLSGGFDYDSG